MSEWNNEGPIELCSYRFEPSYNLNPGSIWMYKADGEGMEISEEKLRECLAKFYAENF